MFIYIKEVCGGFIKSSRLIFWFYQLNHNQCITSHKYIFIYQQLQVTYLQDFATKLGLNIHYNSEIVSVAREKNNGDGKGDMFTLKDRNNTLYHCRIVVIGYV